MQYRTIIAFDIPSAWFKILNEIWENGDIFNVGYGSETTETKKLNLSIRIAHPENRPLVDDKAPCDMKYVQEYALKFLWSSEKYEETYSYGSRMHKPIDQIEAIIKRFIECPYDRQCTVVIRLPSDIQKGFEPPCLSLLDFEILEGKLNMIGYFRSWDAYGGLPANIAGLQLFNEALVKELNEKGLDVKTGEMIFHSKNCHIYKRCYPLVESLLYPKER